MFASLCAHPRIRPPWRDGAMLACLLLAGCAQPPPLALGPHPADAHARVPAVAYRSTISGYTRQRPVEPASWREQNERVAPSPRQ